MEACNRIAVDPDFLELARQRETALGNARRQVWQGVVAEQAVELERLQA